MSSPAAQAATRPDDRSCYQCTAICVGLKVELPLCCAAECNQQRKASRRRLGTSHEGNVGASSSKSVVVHDQTDTFQLSPNRSSSVFQLLATKNRCWAAFQVRTSLLWGSRKGSKWSPQCSRPIGGVSLVAYGQYLPIGSVCIRQHPPNGDLP